MPPLRCLVLSPGPSDHTPPSSALFSCLRSRHPRQARLDNARRPLRPLTRGERRRSSRPCRSHAHRAWPPHISAVAAWGVRWAGTLDRGPGRVRRSIGQSAVPCQKQNGPLRSALSCVSSAGVSARHNATASREQVYSLCHACCLVDVWGSAGKDISPARRSSRVPSTPGLRARPAGGETALPSGEIVCRMRVVFATMQIVWLSRVRCVQGPHYGPLPLAGLFPKRRSCGIEIATCALPQRCP